MVAAHVNDGNFAIIFDTSEIKIKEKIVLENKIEDKLKEKIEQSKIKIKNKNYNKIR